MSDNKVEFVVSGFALLDWKEYIESFFPDGSSTSLVLNVNELKMNQETRFKIVIEEEKGE